MRNYMYFVTVAAEVAAETTGNNNIVNNLKSGAENILSLASSVFIILLVLVLAIIGFACLICGEEGRSKIKKHFAWIIGGCAILGLCGTIAGFLATLFGTPSIPVTTPDGTSMLDIVKTWCIIMQIL